MDVLNVVIGNVGSVLYINIGLDWSLTNVYFSVIVCLGLFKDEEYVVI